MKCAIKAESVKNSLCEMNSRRRQIYIANKVVLNSIMYAHNQLLKISTFPFDNRHTILRGEVEATEAVTVALCHFFIVQYFPPLPLTLLFSKVLWKMTCRLSCVVRWRP